MKKTRRLLIFILVLAATLSMSPGAQKAQAAEQAYVTHYWVYYVCVFDPQPLDNLLGEWVVGCDGNWDGWGWMPDSNCTYTAKITEEACS